MDVYERFLTFDVVVNIKSEEAYKKFISRCKQLSLKSIKWIERFSFEDLHKDAGIRVIADGELCIEYQIGKGFTVGKRKDYRDYGVGIISTREFLMATEPVE